MNTEKTKTNEATVPDEIFYDGECPMCGDLAAHFAAKAAAAAREHFTPLQTPGVAESLGKSRETLMELMHIRAADGRVFAGADGFVYLLSRRWWGRPAAALFALPGALPLARVLYGLVARNRIRISRVLLNLPWLLPLLWLLLASGLHFAVPGFGRIEFLFLLAPLALVPSVAGLLAARRDSGGFSITASVPFVLASIPVAASFLLPKGIPAVALTLPWMVLAILRAARWLRDLPRLAHLRGGDWIAACADAFLVIGAGWLAASRLGFAPMGFAEPIVLLTAVHFHFTGFTTLNLVLLAGRRISPAQRLTRLALLPALGIAVSMPLVALGFVVSLALKSAGITLLVVAMMGVSVLFLATGLRSAPRPGMLMIAAALAPIAGMALTLLYLAGEWTGHEIISIPTMAATHGILNGIGFSLLGLWGLASSPSEQPRRS